MTQNAGVLILSVIFQLTSHTLSVPITRDTRPALSFNQDLQSLVQMIEGGRASSRNALLRLGKRDGGIELTNSKRAPDLSFNQDLQSLSDLYGRGMLTGAQNQLMRLGKRARPMSFNADLQSLANMVGADNQRYTHEGLLSLGKREAPVEIDHVDDSIADTMPTRRSDEKL